MVLQLLSSVDFWIGIVAMLALMCVAALAFILLDAPSTPQPMATRRAHQPPSNPWSARLAASAAKPVLTNLVCLIAVAAFWALLIATTLAPQP